MMARGRTEVSPKLRTICQGNCVHAPSRPLGGNNPILYYLSRCERRFMDAYGLTQDAPGYIIKFTTMPNPTSRRSKDAKAEALRSCGALHPDPGAVKEEAFSSHEFFDPRDRVQVKYEMVRRHRIDGHPITEVAKVFGMSRQAFYKTAATLEGQGIPGLLPRRRGPKRARKCTDEVLDFVEQWEATPIAERGDDVVQAIERHFGIRLHPRSLDRAMVRRNKKKRQAKGWRQS